MSQINNGCKQNSGEKLVQITVQGSRNPLFHRPISEEDKGNFDYEKTEFGRRFLLQSFFVFYFPTYQNTQHKES